MQHATIVDALAGRRLDIFKQCVPIKVVSASAGMGSSEDLLAQVTQAEGVAHYLHAVHEERAMGRKHRKMNMLLTAEPAAGKTCLLSQLVVYTLRDGSDLVPVLIKVQQLMRQLLLPENRRTFESAWNCEPNHSSNPRPFCHRLA